jgi:dTDP-4-amino-4,6-dideoxygalactose transaminase
MYQFREGIWGESVTHGTFASMSEKDSRVYLSVPHMSGAERELVSDAFDSNWLTTVGAHVDAFEREVTERLDPTLHALAVTNGTAALHLILRQIGVGPGDRVAVSTLTFAASVFPILYLGASPVLIDSEETSGNMDPALVRAYLAEEAVQGTLPRALILVHLYGQHADVDAIRASCVEHGVKFIEDSAESLGSTYRGRETGTSSDFSFLSFNGNKIITTTAGGMVLTRDEAALARMRKWANQSREPAVEYLHRQVGFNYRMSNVLAAIGRGQLRVLDERVEARRAVAERYRAAVESMDGVSLQGEAPWGKHTRWLSVIFLDPAVARATPAKLIAALEEENIESRPVWRPMHTQPLFTSASVIGGAVAEKLYSTGVCLPSSSSLTEASQERVISVMRRVLG